jgi:hypothetical protein
VCCAVCAQVNFEGRLTGPEALVAAVEECGFDCRLQSVHNVDAEDDDDERLQVRGGGGPGRDQGVTTGRGRGQGCGPMVSATRERGGG